MVPSTNILIWCLRAGIESLASNQRNIQLFCLPMGAWPERKKAAPKPSLPCANKILDVLSQRSGCQSWMEVRERFDGFLFAE